MRLLFIFFIGIFLLSCKNSSETVSKESSEISNDEVNSSSSASTAYDINDLTKFVGQMPSEANIFQIAGLGDRTKNIMGQHFIDFEKGWFDKLPIQQYEDYIYFGGCQFENCDGIKYFIIVDLTEDNINVLHYGGKRPYGFEEGAIIGMPERISDAFEAFRE